MTKLCSRCKIEKDVEEFYKRPDRPIGYRSDCKKCCLILRKIYVEGHKEEISKCRKEYYRKNSEKELKKHRQWYQENKEKVYLYSKEYRERHRSKYVEYARRHIQNNPNARLALNLRTRLNRAIDIKQKKGSAVRDLGCTIEYLREYLAQLFRDDMSWDNYGPVWEIDHIIPLSLFDLTDRDQFLKACHYTNLQPLYIGENRRKSNKYTGAR